VTQVWFDRRMIREAELFVMAEQMLLEVLGRIRPEHRNIIIPPKFYREVRDILVPGTTMVLVEGSIAGGGAGEKLTVLASQ